MKRQSGIILLSVISLLMIGTAFEMQRYANFCERQTMYRLIIAAFEHPEQTVDAVTSRPTPDSKLQSAPTEGRPSMQRRSPLDEK